MRNWASGALPVPRTSGTYPNIETIPDTSPGSKDGTPLHKAWVDDWFGFAQAVMQCAGTTWSDTAETGGTGEGDNTGSQLLTSILDMIYPAGQLRGLFTDTIPAHARLLELDGSTVLRADYPRLVAAVEQPLTATGSFYRCTAGGGYSASGTYLKLPDLRGQFIRGRDSAGAVDPTGATRDYGDVQGDALQTHEHDLEYDVGTGDVKMYVEALATQLSLVGGSTNAVIFGTTDSGTNDVHTSDSISGALGSTSETRPTNSMVLWCITY